ncbi:MAG: hypothetical protein HZB30_00160 [Nitrospirae bacterium]|nr:hypothetical protein [Nitrospirota bacterium]
MTTATKKKKTAVSKTKSEATGIKMKKGSKYQCGVCGIAVTVDEVCGCVEAHNIICCDKPMKPKKK